MLHIHGVRTTEIIARLIDLIGTVLVHFGVYTNANAANLQFVLNCCTVMCSKLLLL